MKHLWPVLFFFGACAIAPRRAAEARPVCFQFEIARAPQRVPTPGIDLEDWCYQVEGTETFIFPANETQIRPELTALIERDAVNRRIVSHGSLFRGAREIRKSFLPHLEPLPVPSDFTQAMLQGTPIAPKMRRGALEAAWDIRDQLRAAPLSTSRLKIEAGVFSSYLPVSKMPYAAYWWPFIGLPLSITPYSPLAKYDAWVEKATGTNPHSREWETKNHSTTTVAWGGHCNGWAAKTFLYPKATGANDVG